MAEVSARRASPPQNVTAFQGAEPVPFASQSERRRAQLIQSAARLIEAEGLEAATMAAVAELAGCTRALVHGYFRRREDLLQAVVVEFYAKLQARLAEIEELLDGESSANLAQFTDAALEAGWDVIEQGGLAGLIMVTATHCGPSLFAFVEGLRRPIIDRFAHLFSGVLSPSDAEMLMELNMATAYRLALKRRSGEITRDEAVALWQHHTKQLIHGFASDI